MSELHEDEQQYLAESKRCEHEECGHLEALHWSDDEGSGCYIDECQCDGMSVDMSGYSPPDPNDPLPRIWGEEVKEAANYAWALRTLIDRSFDTSVRPGTTSRINGR